MRTNCIYPGTFDPITNGHLDVIKRALRIFDNVIVAVAKSDNKKPFFELDKRVKMVKEATKSLENIEVMAFENLLVDFEGTKQVWQYGSGRCTLKTAHR